MGKVFVMAGKSALCDPQAHLQGFGGGLRGGGGGAAAGVAVRRLLIITTPTTTQRTSRPMPSSGR